MRTLCLAAPYCMTLFLIIYFYLELEWERVREGEGDGMNKESDLAKYIVFSI